MRSAYCTFTVSFKDLPAASEQERGTTVIEVAGATIKTVTGKHKKWGKTLRDGQLGLFVRAALIRRDFYQNKAKSSRKV